MMKTKNAPRISASRRTTLYPALTLGLILAWLALKAQIDRILHGGHEIVLYPLLVIAGFPETWLIAVVLGCIMVYGHIRGMRNFPDESRYNALGFGSGFLQGLMLLYGAVFMPTFMVHIQSLSTADHTYHLSKGDVRVMGGFGGFMVMECGPIGILCTATPSHLIPTLCSVHGGELAIDPETRAVVIRVGSETYPIKPDEDHDICRDIFRRAMER